MSKGFLWLIRQRSSNMDHSLDDLVIEEKTRSLLKQYLDNPEHALMLTGVIGCGLGTIARSLSCQIAKANTVFLQPTLHNKQKTSIINADDVADLSVVTRDHRRDRLVIIIDDADRTAPGVFERLLKLIEEPAPGVHYIFTTHNLSNIPATILSRSSFIKVNAPSSEGCQILYKDLDAIKKSQVKFLADRKPSLIYKLINDQPFFDNSVKSMEIAKELFQAKLGRKIEIVSNISEREQAIDVCYKLEKIVLRIANRSNANANKASRRLDVLTSVVDRISGNGNLKTELLYLATNL